MKQRVATIVVFTLGIGLSAAMIYNVVADNSAVKKQAATVACGDLGADCKAQFTMEARTPFSHTYKVVTPKRAVEVSCSRAAILVGAYSCSIPR